MCGTECGDFGPQKAEIELIHRSTLDVAAKFAVEYGSAIKESCGEKCSIEWRLICERRYHRGAYRCDGAIRAPCLHKDRELMLENRKRAHLLLMGVHTSICLVVMPLPTVLAAKVDALGADMRARPALEGCTLATAAGHTMIEAQIAAIVLKLVGGGEC